MNAPVSPVLIRPPLVFLMRLVVLMRLGLKIRFFPHDAALRNTGTCHRDTAIQEGGGFVAGDFAGGCAPC